MLITSQAVDDFKMLKLAWQNTSANFEKATLLFEALQQKYPDDASITQNLIQARTDVQALAAALGTVTLPEANGIPLAQAFEQAHGHLNGMLSLIETKQTLARHQKAAEEKEAEEKAAVEAKEREEYARYQELHRKYGQAETSVPA